MVPIAVITGLLAFLPFTTCLMKLSVGLPCPGCGMTRATLRLLRGDIPGSLHFHPVVLPGALGMLVTVVLALALREGHPAWERFVRVAMALLAVGLMGTWALRMAHVLPMV